MALNISGSSDASTGAVSEFLKLIKSENITSKQMANVILTPYLIFPDFGFTIISSLCFVDEWKEPLVRDMLFRPVIIFKSLFI